MDLIKNRFVIRIMTSAGVQHNAYAYWTGKSFMVNSGNARNYKNEEQAARVVKHLIKFVLKYNGNPRRQIPGITPADLGLYSPNDSWETIQGLLEICVAFTSRGHLTWIPIEHCITWLKGSKSFDGVN